MSAITQTYNIEQLFLCQGGAVVGGLLSVVERRKDIQTVRYMSGHLPFSPPPSKSHQQLLATGN